MQSTIKEYITLRLWKVYIYFKQKGRRTMEKLEPISVFYNQAKTEFKQDMKVVRGQK